VVGVSPFDEKPSAHGFHYLPHRNCGRLAEWCGVESLCDGEGESDHPFTLPDGSVVPAGDWVFRHGDGFEVVPDGDVFERVRHRGHLEA